MTDKKDIQFKSTKRQDRLLPDDSFKDWNQRGSLAEKIVPIVGSLYKKGVFIGCFFKNRIYIDYKVDYCFRIQYCKNHL